MLSRVVSCELQWPDHLEQYWLISHLCKSPSSHSIHEMVDTQPFHACRNCWVVCTGFKARPYHSKHQECIQKQPAFLSPTEVRSRPFWAASCKGTWGVIGKAGWCYVMTQVCKLWGVSGCSCMFLKSVKWIPCIQDLASYVGLQWSRQELKFSKIGVYLFLDKTGEVTKIFLRASCSGAQREVPLM